MSPAHFDVFRKVDTELTVGEALRVGDQPAVVVSVTSGRAHAHAKDGVRFVLSLEDDGWTCTAQISQRGEVRIEAHEVHPGLWQGSRPPKGRALTLAGFHAVVLCAEQFQPDTHEFESIRVIRAPIQDADDFRSGDIGLVVSAARLAAELVQAGQKVLVTCEFGHNRSGLVLGTALHLVTGWRGQKVVETVKAKRPLALTNPLFVRCLQGVHDPFVDVLFP